MGGVYIPVNLRTSICPFPSYEGVVDPVNGELDKDEIASIVNFIDLCVTDQGRSGFDIVTTDVVARAIQGVYEGRLRSYRRSGRWSGSRGGAEDIRETAQDKAIAQDVARRLGIYCDGLYADFLNRESELRFDSRLLTFDMAEVSQNAMAKKLAMATIMRAIGNRAAARRNRTLVEVDEGHEYLGTDAVPRGSSPAATGRCASTTLRVDDLAEPRRLRDSRLVSRHQQRAHQDLSPAWQGRGREV